MTNSVIKSHQGWRTIGDKSIYFKSKWEMNFARYLQWLKVNKSISKWEYESHTFWFEGLKRGTVSYKPDFFILENDGFSWYAEVKGYFDSKSLTKIKRFKRYYPNLNLRIIDKNWFTRNNKQMKGLIKEWE